MTHTSVIFSTFVLMSFHILRVVPRFNSRSSASLIKCPAVHLLHFGATLLTTPVSSSTYLIAAYIYMCAYIYIHPSATQTLPHWHYSPCYRLPSLSSFSVHHILNCSFLLSWLLYALLFGVFLTLHVFVWSAILWSLPQPRCQAVLYLNTQGLNSIYNTNPAVSCLEGFFNCVFGILFFFYLSCTMESVFTRVFMESAFMATWTLFLSCRHSLFLLYLSLTHFTNWVQTLKVYRHFQPYLEYRYLWLWWFFVPLVICFNHSKYEEKIKWQSESTLGAVWGLYMHQKTQDFATVNWY